MIAELIAGATGVVLGSGAVYVLKRTVDAPKMGTGENPQIAQSEPVSNQTPPLTEKDLERIRRTEFFRAATEIAGVYQYIADMGKEPRFHVQNKTIGYVEVAGNQYIYVPMFKVQGNGVKALFESMPTIMNG